MNPTPLSNISLGSGGTLLAPEAGAKLVHRVCTDSRSIQPGDLYVALRGEHFDGHAFVASAFASGAVAALVEQGYPEGPCIVVKDTLAGLQTLASHHREEMPARRVVITGSNGKTSTKDMTASVFSMHYRTMKTEGNLNNHIGLPLTLLALNREIEAAILEIGMNHRGEIAALADIAAPQIAIITNIGVAHIENLGSQEAIAAEKGDLAAALPENGILILNAEDPFSLAIAKRTSSRVIFTGGDSGELRAIGAKTDGVRWTFDLEYKGERVTSELPVPGRHMLANALLAAGAGLAGGLELSECAAGLAQVTLTKGRLTRREVAGLVVLDDSYNANPDSMIAALKTLQEYPCRGRRIAVLGRMGELGSHAEEGHRRVGREVAAVMPDLLVALGGEGAWISLEAASRGIRTTNAGSLEEAADIVMKFAKPEDVLLIKASRSVGIERLLPMLENWKMEATR